MSLYALSLPKVKSSLRNITFRFPYLGNTLLKLEFSTVFSSLATMFKGGVEISQAVKHAISVTTHPQIKNILEESLGELKKGRKLSEIWRKYPLIPPEVTALLSVGENSGNLDEVLLRLGRKYLNEFKSEVMRLLTFLEPAVIVVVGFFIALIVTAILLAVLSISDVF